MRLTVSTSLLKGQLIEKIAAAKAVGFSGVDINHLDFVASELSAEEIANRASEIGIAIHKYQALRDIEGQKDDARKGAFARLDHELDMAKRLGASTVLLAASSQIEENIEESVINSDLCEIAERATKLDLRIAYLPMPWASRNRTSQAAYERVEVVNHPSFGLALNSYFLLTDGSKPAQFREIDGTKIFSVQLADAPISDFDISRLKHEFACLPGLGDLNLPSFVRALSNCGYQGAWSLARMGHQTGLGENPGKNGYRSIADLIDRARVTLPEGQLPSANIPDRAHLHGYEYLEFALDQQSADVFRTFLGTLCFRLERKHNKKPVELWRQGAINIVINTSSEGLAGKVFQSSGPSLCEMGMRVKDAEAAQKRAAALGVVSFSQPVREGDIDIPAINGIGQSIIRFIDEKSELHRVWDVEFEPAQTNQAIPPAGLRRIDHLAQTMEREKLDEWLIFFLSVFDMTKSPLVDIVDPGGVIYSRALESPEGEVRLNLNGASSQQSFSGAFLAERHSAALQHMAFATDDIFESSVRLFESGFKRLPIPANYYANLKAQYGLDDAMIKDLSVANILYLRNETGEFFQIYSEPIWGGFFVEIVERRHGYSGYGARNAPVRIAAQSRIQSSPRFAS